MLNEEKIEKYSGVRLTKYVQPLRKNYFRVEDIPLPGDAPKNFIRVYEYGEGVRRHSVNTWPAFIAKVGHKWYPVESITEHLLNRIGEVLGLNMASSKLMLAGKQLRFLSRYFLKTDERLVHAAEIFAGYLQDDVIVEEIENKGRAREFFTFQFVEQAIKTRFPDHAEMILHEFIKMLTFDAITGNNDRHFYNWGVIVHIETKKMPKFAPVYDSARGLFWNISEHEIWQYFTHPKEINRRLAKYIENSKPKTGWDSLDEINHFSLLEKIFRTDARYQDDIRELLFGDKLNKIFTLIDIEFAGLLSSQRIELVKRCLQMRWERLVEILSIGYK
jgi:hypothetical protein